MTPSKPLHWSTVTRSLNILNYIARVAAVARPAIELVVPTAVETGTHHKLKNKYKTLR